jgi:two-component system CheB/CheR fusion protein
VANSEGDKMLFVRILPYAIPSTTGRGAVTSFVDVSAYHDAKRLQSVLDGLLEHVAVLDRDGTIRMVNAAWTRFAQANGDPDLNTTGLGCNYISSCQTTPEDTGRDVSAVLTGLRGVLEGSLPCFSSVYPCHSPTEQRWYVMSVAPLSGPFSGAIVSHFNVTPWFERGTH